MHQHQANDPTQTLTLRRAYMREFRRRWALVLKAIKATIIDNDALRLRGLPELATSQDEPIPEPPEDLQGSSNQLKTAAFILWLTAAIDSAVLGIGEDDTHSDWQEPFIRQAYAAGLRHAGRDANQLDGTIDTTPIETVIADPLHEAEIAALAATAFDDVGGISDVALAQIAAVVAAGLAEGLTPEQLFDDVEGRISAIGMTRSETLATTAVVSTVNQSILKRLAQIGLAFVAIDVELSFWKTAEDPDVCIICREGTSQDNGFGPGIYTLEQAVGLLPAHPRCRCRWVPVRVPDVLLGAVPNKGVMV